MDSEQLTMVQRMIEEAVAPLRMAIEAQSAELEQLVKKAAELEEQIDNLDNNTPDVYHAHDEYASVDHVERSEQNFESRLYRLENDLNNLDYRVNEVDRKAENAARNAGGRGYW